MIYNEAISDNHFIFEDFRERMSVKKWKAILMVDGDKIFFRGQSRRLVATSLGHGIVEVTKAPLEKKEKP